MRITVDYARWEFERFDYDGTAIVAAIDDNLVLVLCMNPLRAGTVSKARQSPSRRLPETGLATGTHADGSPSKSLRPLGCSSLCPFPSW